MWKTLTLYKKKKKGGRQEKRHRSKDEKHAFKESIKGI